MLASALGPMGALEVGSLHGAKFLGADRVPVSACTFEFERGKLCAAARTALE